MAPFAPVLERILVEQVQVLGDLRLSEHLFVLLGTKPNHPGDQGGCRRQMIRGERQTLRVQVVDRQVPVGMDDDRTRTLLDGGGVDPVAQPSSMITKPEVPLGLGQ